MVYGMIGGVEQWTARTSFVGVFPARGSVMDRFDD